MEEKQVLSQHVLSLALDTSDGAAPLPHALEAALGLDGGGGMGLGDGVESLPGSCLTTSPLHSINTIVYTHMTPIHTGMPHVHTHTYSCTHTYTHIQTHRGRSLADASAFSLSPPPPRIREANGLLTMFLTAYIGGVRTKERGLAQEARCVSSCL